MYSSHPLGSGQPFPGQTTFGAAHVAAPCAQITIGGGSLTPKLGIAGAVIEAKGSAIGGEGEFHCGAVWVPVQRPLVLLGDEHIETVFQKPGALLFVPHTPRAEPQ